MAKFKPGDVVSVPAARLGIDAPFAMVDRKVLATEGRSVRLDQGPDGVKVASRLVVEPVQLRLIRLGDIASEDSLLDPVTKGLHHYFRLLLPEYAYRTWWVRTLPELRAYLADDPTPTHVVLVGHCDKSTGRLTLTGEQATPIEFLGAFAASPKTFLSLACSSGQKSFAGPFSEGEACGSLVAPFQAIHGAVAVEAGVLTFNNLFLRGESLLDAVRHVNDSLPSGMHLRVWRQGKFETPGSTAKDAQTAEPQSEEG